MPTLVQIPAGRFLMGCESGQDNERPVHRIWVDAFSLAACQVTNAEYVRFLRDTRSLPPPFWNDSNLNLPEQPVVGVSWFEVVRYCNWLSEQTGRCFRLPTEAEWKGAEAARALCFLGATRRPSRSPVTATSGRQ